jgi:predicted metal-dependent hydrolase
VPALQSPTFSVEVTRSPKRRRTLSARLVGSRLLVRVPARTSSEEEQRFVERMLERFAARVGAKALPSPAALLARARELSERYFAGELRPASVEVVTNQSTLYGSCTIHTGRIRLSHKLAGMPVWVRDYVLVHELAHLRVARHNRRFWALVNRYELAERARGFLMGAGYAEASVDPDSVEDDPPDGA